MSEYKLRHSHTALLLKNRDIFTHSYIALLNPFIYLCNNQFEILIHMKKYIILSLSLLLSVSSHNVSAQGFLKKLGKEIENKVEKKVTKQINKLKGEKTQQSQDKSQSATNQEESPNNAKERHLKILEERGEIVRPVIVENPPQDQASVTGKTNGHEWIDLGLPSGTRWATCNIGATQPSQPGRLYAWGETATKTSYIPGNSKTHGKDMNDISGNATYDVATAKWGKGWRMPTKEEFDELVTYCPFPKYEKQNGRWGQKFTNRINGRTIFLPATGFKENGSKHQEASGCGNYWTSTPQEGTYKNGAHEYHFGAALGEMGQGERSSGFAIRAVIDNDAMITVPSQGETNGHKWVDLGLPSGTKWATCNIGAKSSEEYGATFAWAKIKPKIGDSHERNEAEGKWMSGIGGSKTYDAATALWGESWKMPTKANMRELMEHCTWEYTTLGRSTGLKVTSKTNGNYIFFPIKFYEKIAKYWTSIPTKTSDNYSSEALTISQDMIIVNGNRRSECYPIRPVTK